MRCEHCGSPNTRHVGDYTATSKTSLQRNIVESFVCNSCGKLTQTERTLTPPPLKPGECLAW